MTREILCDDVDNFSVHVDSLLSSMRFCLSLFFFRHAHQTLEKLVAL
jgi:hypothetical protein